MPIRTMDKKKDDFHAGVYSHMHRAEICAGMGGGTHVMAQSNSRPLTDFVESASIRSVPRYDWMNGTMTREPLDIVSNAHRNLNTLKIRPVTNARHFKDQENEYCYPAVQSVPANPKQSKSSKSKSRSRKGK